MYAMLKARTTGLRSRLIDFASDLLRIPSYSLHESDLADRVEAEMRQLGFDEVVRDDAGNVVGVNYGRSWDKTVLLNSHMDTVDVGEASEWQVDPFAGLVQGGQLHGRGASDCKSGLAAQVYAATLLKSSMLPMNGTVVVAASVAEENGRSVGVRALLEDTLPEMDIRPSWAVLGEPTGLKLRYGHDGWVELDICLRDRQPERVRHCAARVFEEIATEEREAGSPDRLEELAVAAPVFERNVMDRARVHVSRRLRFGEEESDAVNALERSARRALGPRNGTSLDVQVSEDSQQLYNGKVATVRRVARAWAIDPFCPLMERSRHALGAAGLEPCPGKWRLDHLGMGTAGGVLTGSFDIPTIGYGPGEESEAHAVNEKVSIRNLATAVTGTAAIVQALAGVPVFGWTMDEI